MSTTSGTTQTEDKEPVLERKEEEEEEEEEKEEDSEEFDSDEDDDFDEDEEEEEEDEDNDDYKNEPFETRRDHAPVCCFAPFFSQMETLFSQHQTQNTLNNNRDCRTAQTAFLWVSVRTLDGSCRRAARCRRVSTSAWRRRLDGGRTWRTRTRFSGALAAATTATCSCSLTGTTAPRRPSTPTRTLRPSSSSTLMMARHQPMH